MTFCRIPALVFATAAAWQLVPASASRTVAIDIDVTSVEGRISPHLYGQFMEFMFEGIKHGLYAEMLRNRGFEEAPNTSGLPPSWERYPDDRDDDYAMAIRRDDEVAYPDTQRSEGTTGGHALHVDLKPGVVQRHGVYQARVPVRSGIEYRGYLWLKGQTFDGGVTVALEADANGGRVYDEARIAKIGGDWTKHSFRLRPKTSNPLARFAILFDGQGTVWIDQVSLIPGDAVDDVRADVFEKVKALHPAFIRWPGGNVAQDYHWQWGIGPRDTRPTWINLSWRNELEPSDFGTNEFIRFARNVGAEPSITVNVEGRGATVEEAAAWVEYCNGPASSRYGSMRARDGHTEPYQVKYWEIGNEIWGDWVRGHSDADTYARNLTKYVAAMRAVDPSIKVIAVGDNDMAWNRTVVQRSGEPFDYLAIHHYYGQRNMQGDLTKLLARPLHYEEFYGEVEALFRQLSADRLPRLAINEWGLDLPESQQYSILAALYAARLMNVFERRSDLVAMSAVSDLVNGWPGGIIQAGRQGVFVTPIYLVNRLYASRLGAERLKTRVVGPSASSGREGSDMAVVDAVASRSEDGRRMYLKAVNTDLEHGLTARIRVIGTNVSATALVERVTADSVTAVNGFGTPESVKITRESITSGNSFPVDLPRHSVTVVSLTATR
jgi:alpha-N-arabinofuranosidase